LLFRPLFEQAAKAEAEVLQIQGVAVDAATVLTPELFDLEAALCSSDAVCATRGEELCSKQRIQSRGLVAILSDECRLLNRNLGTLAAAIRTHLRRGSTVTLEDGKMGVLHFAQMVCCVCFLFHLL
jgi:hypothetical protein